MASLLGFAPERGVVNVDRRYFDYPSGDGMMKTKYLDEYDLDLAFDSPTVCVSRLRLDELLPMSRLVAHFSSLDDD